MFFPGTRLPAEELPEPVSRAVWAFVERASRRKAKFPGPSPCSIERRDFRVVAGGGYWLAAKNDGVRAALVCLRINDVDYVAFVDRARRTWVLRGPPVHVCTAWFQGTIVDGELVDGDFVAFDCLAVSGAAVGHLPFSARREAMTPGLALHAAVTAPQPLRLCLKLFHHPRDFAMADDGRSDGIIAMPEAAPYIVGRHTALFKLKQRHTIDFTVLDDGARLAVLDKGGLVAVARAAEPAAPGSVVECELDPGGGLWRVLLTRTDKDHPNDMLTYTKTLKNIKEAITYAEFLKLFV